MPAYVYPEPDELSEYRANNTSYNVWEAIAQLTASTGIPGSGFIYNNISLMDTSGQVWQLRIDADGVATTTKIALPNAPQSFAFWAPNGTFFLSVDTDGSLLTTKV